MESSLLRTDAFRSLHEQQSQPHRAALHVSKSAPRNSSVQTSTAAHNRFSAAQAATKMRKSPVPPSSVKPKVYNLTMRELGDLTAANDSYDLRAAFDAIQAKKGARMSFSARFSDTKPSPGVGDYEIRRSTGSRLAASLSDTSRFESVEERLYKEMYYIKYNIPHDQNIGPQDYFKGVAAPERQAPKICRAERFTKNIVLEKHMEPGIGLTRRYDLTRLRGGVFSESGHALDSHKAVL